MNNKFEINKLIYSVLSDLVQSEYLTDWQAGFVFGFLQCKLSTYSSSDDDVFAFADNFNNYRYKKGENYGIKS